MSTPRLIAAAILMLVILGALFGDLGGLRGPDHDISEAHERNSRRLEVDAARNADCYVLTLGADYDPEMHETLLREWAKQEFWSDTQSDPAESLQYEDGAWSVKTEDGPVEFGWARTKDSEVWSHWSCPGARR